MDFTKDIKNIPKISGIYIIKNDINNKFYIGSTVNLCKRITTHIGKLKTNQHVNSHLQGAVNKYGINNFSFKILVICERYQLFEIEQGVLDYYKCYKHDIGYNMSEIVKGVSVYNTPNHFLGKKHSDKTLAKLRDISRVRFGSREIICNETKQIFIGVKDAAINLKISRNNITKCLTGMTQSTCGYTFRYKDQSDNDISEYDKNIKNYLHNKNKRYRYKILHKNTGKVYNSLKDAARDLGINIKTVTKSVKYNVCTKGHNFVVLEKPNIMPTKQVKCLDTGEIFPCIRKAGKKLNIKYYKNIAMAIKRSGKCCGYSFEYVGDNNASNI